MVLKRSNVMAKSSASKTSILSLPPEVLEKIFSMLDVPDKCRCARVCVDWYNATCNKKVWQKASFTWTTDVDMSDSSTVRDSLISRDIKRFAIKADGVDGRVLHKAISQLPVMESLSIQMRQLYDIDFCKPTFLSTLSQLTELTIVMDIFISVKSVEAMARNLPNLVTLEFKGENKMQLVNNDWMKHIAHNLKKLTRLVLEQCYDVTDSGIAHLTHHIENNYTLPRLQYLMLGRCIRLTNLAFFYLSVGQPYLKYLCTSKTYQITNIGVAQLRNLKHLEEFVFFETQSETTYSYIDSLASLHQLRVLRFKQFFCLTMDLRLLAKMDNLQVLELHTLDFIRKKPWEHFAKMPNLQQLSLFNCSINDESLKALADGGSRVIKLDIVGGFHENVTDKGLQHISRLTHLRELSLLSCWDVSGSGLVHLAKGVAKITNLKLNNNCSGVGRSALDHLNHLNDLRSLTWYVRKKSASIEKGISDFKLNHPDVCVRLICLGINERGLENEFTHLSLRSY